MREIVGNSCIHQGGYQFIAQVMDTICIGRKVGLAATIFHQMNPTVQLRDDRPTFRKPILQSLLQIFPFLTCIIYDRLITISG
jgi:hypothetical protein